MSPTLRGHLRIVRGEPTPEELAALTAIVSAAGSGPDDAADAEPPSRGRWNDPAWTHRQPWPVGPGGWRAAVR